MDVSSAASAIRVAANPLRGDGSSKEDLEALVERAGDASFVLLGEASHGTHEFYALRAELTKRLVVEKGFRAVAVEADWPDAYRADRWLAGVGSDRNAVAALSNFERFPRWMWRNSEVVALLDDLRAIGGVGFYGIDLYSLHASIEAVVRYLEGVDPAAARRARDRYACFDDFRVDPQRYGMSAALGLTPSCAEGALAQLVEIRARSLDAEDAFATEQNARLVRDAEGYYRNILFGGDTTWNLRDAHMADTVEAIRARIAHRAGAEADAKVVIWAHNSHLGDARATEPGEGGQWNVGQLLRERYGADRTFLVGFTTYDGTVTAARDWDEPHERRRVKRGLEGSWEALFHEVAVPAFYVFTGDRHAASVLRGTRLERAIGVIYRPETERASHYFRARIGDQFDAVVHVDRTRALEPLDRGAAWRHDDPPETFPFAV